MRQLALIALLVVAVGCEDKQRPTTSPKEPSLSGDAQQQPVPADCIIKVAIQSYQIAYEGGGLKGTTPKSAPDLHALTTVNGKCGVRVSATDATLYQDVVQVMDGVHKLGLEVSIGDGPRTASKPPPLAAPRPGEPANGQDSGELRPLIRITVEEADVTIQGKSLGTSPHAVGLVAAIQAELSRESQPDPTVILAIDQSLPFAVVRRVIQAVEARGYTKLAFEVRP